jgi:Kef-type K+ transport system membrane component KefB
LTDFFKHLIHEFSLPLSNPVLIFSLILLIILLSPLLLKKINVPGVIGLIIAGVIIGPNGLNFLEKNSAIELFSTIGLLYIMFIAGLELDMNEFRSNRNKSLWFGLFTFVVPLSVAYPVCKYLLGYDFNTSLLTASMLATHTLVAYPIVSRLGISKHQAVAITVGGTVLADTAALVILAVILGNAQGGLTQTFFIQLGVSLTVFSAIMFLVVPRIAIWFFRKLESEKYAQYIFVLSVVFFSAFLAEVAGVEPIIGAFVAGLALNRLIPHTSALMNRIEFIGNSLFIPFFLISVGMLVDLSVFLASPKALMITAALLAAAILGKWLPAWLAQLFFGYSGTERKLIFGLSSARAAATLAIVLVGYEHGMLDENILNATVALILLTCIVSSFATEKAARKIVVDSRGEGVTKRVGSKLIDEHILLPVANMANVGRLMQMCILIKNKTSNNPISLLTVVSNNQEAEAKIMKAKSELEEFVKEATVTETNVNVMATIDHNVPSGIGRTAKEIVATTIVLGWPGQEGIISSLTDDTLGSIVSSTDKTTVICRVEQPVFIHKRLVLTLPPLAEYEFGYKLWVNKVASLSRELSLPITVYCDERSGKLLKEQLKQMKLQIIHHPKLYENWHDFEQIITDVKPHDLLVVVSSRKKSTSYTRMMKQLPIKLEQAFRQNNLLMIYPERHYHDIATEHYEDFTAENLEKGIETIQNIGKGLKWYFRRGKGGKK